jgi:hypothetical protein
MISKISVTTASAAAAAMPKALGWDFSRPLNNISFLSIIFIGVADPGTQMMSRLSAEWSPSKVQGRSEMTIAKAVLGRT